MTPINPTPLLDRLYEALWRERWATITRDGYSIGADPCAPLPVYRMGNPTLVVMSRDTFRAMRCEEGEVSGVAVVVSYDPIVPSRVFGVRVAYDDTVKHGEFLLAHVVN